MQKFVRFYLEVSIEVPKWFGPYDRISFASILSSVRVRTELCEKRNPVLVFSYDRTFCIKKMHIVARHTLLCYGYTVAYLNGNKATMKRQYVKVSIYISMESMK